MEALERKFKDELARASKKQDAGVAHRNELAVLRQELDTPSEWLEGTLESERVLV